MTALSLNDLLMLLAALTGAGLVGGLIAGLFGVGGGTVIVPALFYAFSVLGLGGAVAGITSMEGLAIVYGVCVLVVAIQMGLLPERFVLRPDLPTGWGRRIVATVIGLLSAMMGIGGGSFGGMTMALCGRPIHQAVATASGFGLAIGAAASVGFVAFGWDAPGRPPYSLGYVNIPAALVMGLLTTLVAPWGARLAHSLDKRVLRRAFAVYLLVTAASVVLKAL